MAAIATESVSALVDRLRSGDIRALARAISLVENDSPEARALLSACFPHTGHALRIGITGSPGAGKSTLVDRLAPSFRDAGKTVGVVAVDPTSPFTGGAILGDRIRFQERLSDTGFYARSMATRGSLGGLALATADVALVLEASGKDVVLIETVGVGQDEIEIARLADITLVVLVPGMGDDVQSLKAGVMEIADIFVINKSDQPGADRLEREILALQSLSTRSDGWVPPIIHAVATDGRGISETRFAIRSFLGRAGGKDRAIGNWALRLREMLRERLIEQFANIDFHAAAEEIAERRSDPYTITDGWIKQLRN